MSKGFCLIAQNNETTDYVKQACLLAVSIHKYSKNQSVSIITNDKIPKKYQVLFDKIIPIKDDEAKHSDWKLENRYKLYDLTPYNQTIVMDVDMIMTGDISHWWKYLKNYNLFFVSNVTTYRNEKIKSNYYRKTFQANDLPNIYCGIFYFKKNKFSKTFFNLLEVITHNWEKFYSEYAPVYKQKWYSMDVSCAICCKILGIEKEITDKNNFITFVHMKPHIQGWANVPLKWTNVLNWQINKNKQLYIGNYLQNNVFHYTEDEFLDEKIIEALET